MTEREMQYRAAELRIAPDAPEDLREMEILIAPFGETAEHMFGEERYTRGVFGDPVPSSVRLKLERGLYHAGDAIGLATSIEERSDGVYGMFTVSETPSGDEALTLARDGVLGASAGFLIERGGLQEAEDGIMEIRSARLAEVSLTATPAYASAAPVAVRSSETQEVLMEPTTTTETETIDREALRTEILDQVRAELVGSEEETLEATDEISSRSRGHNYRSMGELIGDTITHARSQDPDATARLTALMEGGMVEADGSAINLMRSVPGFPDTNIGNSVGQAFAPLAFVPELLELLREGRPVADLFNGRNLPQVGNEIQLPDVLSGANVGYQDGQANPGAPAVAPGGPLTIGDSKFPKATMWGGQGITLQAAQWSSPTYTDEVVRDLLASYSEFLDEMTIVGDPAVDTPASGTGYTGILDGATDVPAAGTTAKDALAVIGAAWASVYAGSRRSPIAAIMHSVLWGAFLDEVDTDGRPIVTTEAPNNPAGFGDASSIAGTLRGLPVVLDDNVPTDAGGGSDTPIILGSFRDANLYEEGNTPAQIALTYPSVLITDVTVYGFSSLAIRRPAAFAAISGIATP